MHGGRDVQQRYEIYTHEQKKRPRARDMHRQDDIYTKAVGPRPKSSDSVQLVRLASALGRGGLLWAPRSGITRNGRFEGCTGVGAR